MRLGELLVQDGLVTPQQVEEAVSSQILHGMRLGSNLVEIGCISMEVLAEALGRQHQCAAAMAAHYDLIDPSVVAKLTPTQAAQWRAVPLGLSGTGDSHVVIATTDPFPQEIAEMLEGIFERQILQAIAPEMRLFYWLEQVYKIQRLNRFKRANRSTDSEASATSEERQKRAYVRTLSENEVEDQQPQLARIAVKRIAVPLTGELTMMDIGDWKSCMRSIRQSQGRDRIASVVNEILEYGLNRCLSAAVLLMVKENLALGWSGFARGSSDVSVDALAVPLDEDSMLSAPFTAREAFFGKPTEVRTVDQRFWNVLGEPPEDLAILPVVVLDEVACVLYVQSTDTIAGETAEALADVAQAISSALTRLIRAANR